MKSRTVELKQGERFYFEPENAFGFIVSGSVEVYASTTSKTERMFLLTRAANDYFFAALDEFNSVELYLFATTDVTLQLYERNDEELKNLSEDEILSLHFGMKKWFKALLMLPWIHFFASQKDEFVSQWAHIEFLDNIDGNNLWSHFTEHQSIFSLLLSGQFHSLEKYFADRLGQRRVKHAQLMSASIGILLDNKELNLHQEADSNEDIDNVIYIVKRAAMFFKMDTSEIKLPPELKKQLQGLSLLKRLVRRGGMQLRHVRLTGTWHKKDSGIFFVSRNGELAVALPDAPGKYRIYNSDCPEGELIDECIDEIEEDAYICYAGFPSRKLSIKDLLIFMFRQCWINDYKVILIASIIAGFIPIFTPIITKTIFSDIIPIQDRQGLATITQIMMIAGFTTAAVSLVRSIAVLRISTHLDIAAEAALWHRLINLPTSFFRKFTTGEIVQRMNGISAVKSVITGEFVGSIFNTVFSFWSIILMCYYSMRLTLVALAVWIVYFIITAFIYRRVYGFQKNLLKAENKMAGQIAQIFNGLAKFRSQGAESQAFYLWSKCFGETWKWNLKLRWQSNYSTIINAVQPLILTLLLYYTAVYGLGEDAQGGSQATMTYAEFIGFQAAFSTFNATLVSMIPLVVQFFNIRPHIENLRPILETEPEAISDKMEAGKLSGNIEVRHLSFSYKDDGPEVLRDINLSITAGESVAIVGRSGCGKSTLLRLLLGFEKPKRGGIYYDNMDLNELNPSSVRSQMGVVLQNGQLLSGDIFTNIVGTTSLTMDDAWRAAARVGLAEDIAAMPMQMYTIISEGSNNISGGQRQRILLAHSIVNDPKILLLDEATSALDNVTQSIVTNSLDSMYCTRIIVAHRLSTIKNVDRILVIDAGKIVEEGNYDELVAKDGLFAQLVQRQVV